MILKILSNVFLGYLVIAWHKYCVQYGIFRWTELAVLPQWTTAIKNRNVAWTEYSRVLLADLITSMIWISFSFSLPSDSLHTPIVVALTTGSGQLGAVHSCGIHIKKTTVFEANMLLSVRKHFKLEMLWVPFQHIYYKLLFIRKHSSNNLIHHFK